MISLLVKSVLSGLGNTAAKAIGAVSLAKTQTHSENIERLKQAGFYVGYGRTWWDSLVDGINRLVRPLFTGGVLYWFYFCATDPIAFTASVVALQAMPTAFWGLLGTIIVFWFGGKFAENLKRPQPMKPEDLKTLLNTIEKVKDSGNSSTASSPKD